MHINKILIIDDEPIIRNFFKDALKGQYQIQTAQNGMDGIEKLKKEHYDLVFTDMLMPVKTGIDVLKYIKKSSKNTLVVIMTAFGSIDNAVEAMQLGAFQYLIKPFNVESIYTIIQKAKEHINLVKENQFLKKEIASSKLKKVICESDELIKIFNDIKKIAKSNSSVFIYGESGTGKEIVAQAIHSNSHISKNPFIKVNCAAIPDTLIESEFFGHEKGAFTGADYLKQGRFELANSGTLLLDEITEIPLCLQPKLLRAIQEQEFERVGGTKLIKVKIRFISTTNRNIQNAINDKSFRKDLYYRLNVVPIYIPPLRQRPKDIFALSKYFIERFCIENNKPIKKLSNSAINKLLIYPWPGNVRELANIIERTVVLNSNDIIEAENICLDIASKQVVKNIHIDNEISLPIGSTLHEAEKKILLATLKAQNFNKTKTAKILKISIRTLRNKLNQYKLQNI
jgi:two-component system, NtrC family, response regulator AtoC